MFVVLYACSLIRLSKVAMFMPRWKGESWDQLQIIWNVLHVAGIWLVNWAVCCYCCYCIRNVLKTKCKTHCQLFRRNQNLYSPLWGNEKRNISHQVSSALEMKARWHNRPRKVPCYYESTLAFELIAKGQFVDNIKIWIFRACDCMLECRSCEWKASSRVECFDWCMLMRGRWAHLEIRHLMSNNVSENRSALGCYFSRCSSRIWCTNESVTVDWTLT
jgi:hypothetical protein